MGLLNDIELLRAKMVNLGEWKGLSSEETILVSQQLDKAINEFYNSKDSLINFDEINSVINKESLLLITDASGVIIYLNEKCGESVGYMPRELIGKHTRIFKTGLHSEEFYHELWSTLLSGEHWKGEISARRKDGSTVWNFLTIFPILDDDNKPYRFLTMRTDITDLKEKEREAIFKDKQLDSFLEILTNSITGMMDEEGRILFLSPSIETVLGFSARDRIGLSVYDCIDPEIQSDFRKIVDDFKESPGSTISSEISLLSKSGNVVPFEFTAKNYLHDPLLQAIVFTSHDITLQKNTNKELENMMYYDGLTGLPNNRYLDECLDREIEYAINHTTNLAVIQLGLDDFKYINTTLGHQIGDLLLKDFSNRIKSALSETLSVYRIRGDIFIFLQKDIYEIEEVHQTLKGLLSLMSKGPFLIEDNEIFVSVSMGVSIFPYSGEDKQALLKNAEIAMYNSKSSGKNQYRLFSPTMNLYTYKQYTLRNDSKKALLNDEFCIYYQPRINPKTNEMVSAEALIRWEHPKWGMVLPDEFISMAEDSGLIVPIGEWLIRKICYQLKKWESDNLWLKKISINLSALQLLQPNFVKKVASILTEMNINPKWLEFEITESVIIEKEEQVLMTLNNLANLGITIALDDFGTGYSSLSYLKKLPCKTIKIDKSLIKDIHSDKDNHEIIASFITLCHKLKKTIVAEGVENEQQLLILRKLHCDEIQGYLYSKPVDELEYESFLREGKRFKSERAEINPNVNRRRYFRVNLDIPLVADMTIENIAGKKVNIGSSEVMVKNIGAGGLCFYSSLKMPVSKDIILMFQTEITNTILNLRGTVVWKEEKESGIYEYGVEFILDKQNQDHFMKMLYNFQVKLKTASTVQGCRFYKF